MAVEIVKVLYDPRELTSQEKTTLERLKRKYEKARELGVKTTELELNILHLELPKFTIHTPLPLTDNQLKIWEGYCCYETEWSEVNLEKFPVGLPEILCKWRNVFSYRFLRHSFEEGVVIGQHEKKSYILAWWGQSALPSMASVRSYFERRWLIGSSMPEEAGYPNKSGYWSEQRDSRMSRAVWAGFGIAVLIAISFFALGLLSRWLLGAYRIPGSVLLIVGLACSVAGWVHATKLYYRRRFERDLRWCSFMETIRQESGETFESALARLWKKRR